MALVHQFPFELAHVAGPDLHKADHRTLVEGQLLDPAFGVGRLLHDRLLFIIIDGI